MIEFNIMTPNPVKIKTETFWLMTAYYMSKIFVYFYIATRYIKMDKTNDTVQKEFSCEILPFSSHPSYQSQMFHSF